MNKFISKRNLLFVLFNVLVISMYSANIKALIHLSLQKALYSYIMLIPLISLFLVFLKRKKIFSHVRYSFTPGAAIMIFGVMLSFVSMKVWGDFDNEDFLSVMTLATLVFWIGGFVFFYGARSLYEARFAFLYLIFMVPMPLLVKDEITALLQRGSAETANVFFKLSGMPFLREGQTFHFANLSVEVTGQCSGIRSAIALLITSMLGGHIFLRTGWRRAFLVFSALPIALVKNGFRITVLSLLAANVDESYITGSLIHDNGGVFFLVPSLLVLFLFLKVLKRSEQKKYEKLTNR